MIKYENVAGALFGVAIGDAMGKPTEFMKISSIHKMYGRSGHMRLPLGGRVTDDTHMSIYTGSAVLHSRHSDSPSVYARELRRAYVRWYLDPNSGPGRAPGASCMTAVRKLRDPNVRHWQRGTTLSKGCGANMRVAPIAFMPYEMISGLAQQSAAMTHGHPLSLVAAELTALAIHHAANGMPPIDILDWLIRYATWNFDHPVYHHTWLGELWKRWGCSPEAGMKVGWADNLTMLYKVWNRVVMADDGGDACRGIGQAWVADEALGVALFCAVVHANDPAEAVSRGARTNGDSDSIASIAGAIVGAFHGIDGWPVEWQERIEFATDLTALAEGLWKPWTAKERVTEIDQSLLDAKPMYVYTAKTYKSGKSSHNDNAAAYVNWWETAGWGDSSPTSTSATTDWSTGDDMVDEEIEGLLARFDAESQVPAVTRMPSGAIDHSYCAHGNSKAARRRCRNKNK